MLKYYLTPCESKKNGEVDYVYCKLLLKILRILAIKWLWNLELNFVLLLSTFVNYKTCSVSTYIGNAGKKSPREQPGLGDVIVLLCDVDYSGFMGQ